MSIFLYTGIPGSGKSHFLVKKIRDELLPLGRPVVTTIRGVNIPGVTVLPSYVDAHTWPDYDDGTIFVFDEAHRAYPSGLHPSKVHPTCAMFHEHRHRGFEFHFATTRPKNLDLNIREIVEEHVVLRRTNARNKVKMQKFPGCNDDPRPSFTDDDADNDTHHLTPDIFPLYKSASLHVMRPRFPRKIIIWGSVAVAVTFAALGMGYWSFGPGGKFSVFGTESTADVHPLETVFKDTLHESLACFMVVRGNPLTVRGNDGKLLYIKPTSDVKITITPDHKGRNKACVDQHRERQETQTAGM